MYKKVSVNILTWNQLDDTIECIASCQKIEYENFEILVIDNHSKPECVRKIRDRFPNINLIENSANLGYAAGNNAGLKYAFQHGADYVLILNNDVTVEPNVLSELVRAAEKDERVGMAAPKVLYYDDPSTINSLGTSMDWLRLRPYLGECNQTNHKQYPEVVRKDVLVGCALLVKYETVERIGMIDERFFIFHEEADWCCRNLKSGFYNIVVPSAVIYHKASKTMRNFSKLTHYYSSRNILYFVEKNANFEQRIRAAAGFAYLALKNALNLVLSSKEEKEKSRVFFLAVYDYFAKNMGACKRTL